MRPLARFVRYLDSGLRRYLGSIKVPIPELDGLSTVAKSAYGAALNGAAKRASAIRPPIRALNGSWRPHGSRCRVSRWRLLVLRLGGSVRKRLAGVMLRSQNGASKQRAAVIESVQL